MIQSNDTGKNLVLDAALSAWERGWSVFPVSIASKEPMVAWKKFQDELVPQVKVRNWFGADYVGAANLGLATGDLSRVVALDVDEEIGLKEIERRGGMPDTVMVQTRPDVPHKLHFYLQHPGFYVGNFAKKCGEIMLPGLDFRGDGGYVMLPPSLHHSGAGRYEWLKPPESFPIAPIPEWLLDILVARNEARTAKVDAPVVPLPDAAQESDRARKWALGALEKERDKMQATSDGSKHQQRYNGAHALGGLAAHGLLADAEIFDALAVNFGSDRKNAEQTIRDGIRDGKQKPRTLPDFAARNGHQNGHANLPAKPESPTAPAPKVDVRPLDKRGLSEATLRHFHINRTRLDTEQYADLDCYEYPTFTPGGQMRRSRLYVLDPATSGGQRFFSGFADEGARLPAGYNLQTVAEKLTERPCDVWVTSDELSTWYLHQAGVAAVNVFGVHADPLPLLRDLKKRGVPMLELCFGVSEAAYDSMLKAAKFCLKNSLKFRIRALPTPIDGATLADIRDRYNGDAAFAQGITSLTVWGYNKLRDMAPMEEEKPRSDSGDAKSAKAEKLLDILENLDGLDVFHTSQGESYIWLPRDDHSEVWPLGSERFNVYCRHLYNRETSRVVDGGTVENVVGVLSGRAHFEGQKREVFNRVAEHEGRIYLDLCDDDWNVIEIGRDVPGDWRVIKNPPVAFRRAKGMEPLPMPRKGGKWSDLRELLALDGDESQENWILTVAWMVTALRPGRYPYPVLAVHGTAEAGKSTFCKMVRTFVDPNFTTLIGTNTRDDRDLAIKAKNSFVIGFDNLSTMPGWFNDALSSLVTEGSFSTRKLHTNDEEELFKANRPIILNGINENVGKPDFRRRCVKLVLATMDEKRKRDEDEVWKQFHALWPYVLGLLCDALCVAQDMVAGVELPHRKGLVDFAKWVMAAEPVLPWKEGQFSQAYLVNQQEAIDAMNEASSFITGIISYIDEHGFWKGTAGDFRDALNKWVGSDVVREPGWPKTPAKFGEEINRSINNLRGAGITVRRRPRSGTVGRIIEIRRIATNLLDTPDESEVENLTLDLDGTAPESESDGA